MFALIQAFVCGYTYEPVLIFVQILKVFSQAEIFSGVQLLFYITEFI